MAAVFRTFQEVVRGAKDALSAELWDNTVGGAGESVTVRRNHEALARLSFRPRVLRDVSGSSLEVTLLGHRLAAPLFLAPTGIISSYDPEGACAVVRAAAHAGIMAIVSLSASPPIEEAMKHAGGPVFVQIYKHGDREWLDDAIGRGERAGVTGFCFTVDEPYGSFRDRNEANRWRSEPGGGTSDAGATSPHGTRDLRPTFCWEDVRWIRDRTRLPFMLKGIQTPEDAVLAADHGVDVVYVSNHGGRAVGDAPGTVDVLESIAEAVNGRADVIVDSGFTRGYDVLKGVALGARAVGLGRMAFWALGAGGEPGLQRLLSMIRREMRGTLGNIGVDAVSRLGPANLTRGVTPVSSHSLEDMYGA